MTLVDIIICWIFIVGGAVSLAGIIYLFTHWDDQIPMKDATRSTSTTINGRHVEQGTELSITGIPGRYRFRHIDTFDNGRPDEITVTGQRGDARTFYAHRVRTVHRTTKTRT